MAERYKEMIASSSLSCAIAHGDKHEGMKFYEKHLSCDHEFEGSHTK